MSAAHTHTATPHLYPPADTMFSQHYTPIKLEYPEITACALPTRYPTPCIVSTGPSSSCIVDPNCGAHISYSTSGSYSCIPSTGVSIPNGHISEVNFQF